MHDLGSPACGYWPEPDAASPDPVNLSAPPPPKRVLPSVGELREDLAVLLGVRYDPSQRMVDAYNHIAWLIDEHARRTPPADRSVDDALDAAGAPHHDERGSLSTAQRVAWLAGQRDHFVERSRKLADSETLESAMNREDVKASHVELDRLHVPREWADDTGRPAKRRVAARVGTIAATMESIHAALDKGGIIRDGMTVFGRVSAMVDRLREYDGALSLVDSALPLLPTPLGRIKRVVERLLAAEKQGVRLREALGLLTTLAPKMVIGGDREPVEMAREIYDTVTKRLADAESSVLQDDVRDLLRALGIGDHARPCSPHRVVRDEVLPAIAGLRSSYLAAELDKLKVAVQPERDRPHPHGQLSNESTTDFAIRLLHELRDVRDAKRGAGFRGELQALLNRYSMENGSDTPDYVLEEFVTNALAAFDRGVRQRERHCGRQAGASPVVR